MQVCPRCQTSTTDKARFCLNCGAALSPTMPSVATGLLPSQSILANRYIILHKVGQGGMAAVYKAADTHLSGKVWAVKEMSDAALVDPLEKQQAIQAFYREAELLSRLSHPNIPRVADSFSQGSKQYLVMEFVEGETLEKKLDRSNGPLAEAQVRSWAEQLCDVLEYLHAQQPPIVFRDLKPGNIMIDQNGNIKLIDFGIVRFFQPGKAKDTTSFGTAGYAPPEQYGKGQTDARSDLYALGATLHHLLTGRDPALTPFQFSPVRVLNPTVSAAMEQVVMRALEHEPARRWPSAREMKQALNPPTPMPTRGAVASLRTPVLVQGTAAAPQPMQAPAVAPVSYVSARAAAVPPFIGAEMAGFGRRLAAYLIDGVLLYGALMILSAPSMVVSDSSEDTVTALLCAGELIGLLITVWYYVCFQARSGQTLGKKAVGIKVISTDGSPPGKGRYLVRFIGYWVSAVILYVGFLMVLWDQDKQALHDKMANTYVIRV